MNLVVGSNTYNPNISGDNYLSGLAQAINSSGANITASIVNNALSISTKDSSATTIQVNDCALRS